MADMFKRLFGGGGAPSSSTSSAGGVSKTAQAKTFDALQNLQAQEEQMEKRKEVLEAKVKIEEEKVKQYLKENKKSQAMMVLKKKKLLEKQIEGLDVNMTRIMEQRAQLESNQATIASVAALKQATAAQKATMSEMNIDNVVDTLEQIQDANDQMNEINQALANPIGMGTDLDEDDLAAELDAMNNDMMVEGAQKMEGDLLAAGAVPITTVPTPAQQEALPSVPSKPAAVKKTPEELELEAIQKEMGLLEAA